jgi:hypothetical protein
MGESFENAKNALGLMEAEAGRPPSRNEGLLRFTENSVCVFLPHRRPACGPNEKTAITAPLIASPLISQNGLSALARARAELALSFSYRPRWPWEAGLPM